MKTEEILAICLEEIRQGRSTLEECLKRYPDAAEELRPLLQIAASLKADEVQASVEFKNRARRRLFEEMQPGVTGKARWGWPRSAGFRALALVILSLLVVGIAGGGTVFAAQGSLPGDALYPVKTGFENFQLAITPGTEGKADLHLEIAQKRIDEASRLVEMQRPVDEQALSSVQQQLDAALQEIGSNQNSQEARESLQHFTASTLNQQLEIQQALSLAPPSSQKSLQQALDATRRGNLISQVARDNPDFLQTQPSVSDQKIDSGQFNIDGILLAISGQNWTVGEVTVPHVHYSGKSPDIGSHIQIEGVVKNGQAFVSHLELVQGPASPATTVQGQVGQVNPDGTTDVGGIPVKIGDGNASQLKPGDNVQLQGGNEKGKLDVTAKKNQEEQNASGPSLQGVLTKIDGAKTTISVKSSGNLVQVNLAQAQIKAANGKSLKFSDLNNYVGKDVTLDGLSKKGDVIFAQSLTLKAGD